MPSFYKNRIYICSNDKTLYCLDMDGKELWRLRTPDMVWYPATGHNNRIYFTCRDCHLYCVRYDTGKELWRFATSISVPAYFPPMHEAFESVMKIRKTEEELEKEEKHKYGAHTLVPEVFGEYQMKSQYKTKSEYKTESEYK
jgi:glucose dehydrogenase